MNEMRLSNIAGYKKEKEELINIIEILNNREVYYQKGAHIPKGLILYGQPGNGKTLFAKVLANECNFTFYEFDLTKKGMSNRLKIMIEKAKETAPSIIFIDELSRLVDTKHFQSDSSRRNLSTLLSLLDGFNTSVNDEVFIAATTNEYDDIPKALVRPGRMDKKIHIGYPTSEDRKDILKYYINKTNCVFLINEQNMIEMTSALSAAGIETLINSCVLSSTIDNEVTEEIFIKNLNSIISETIEKDLSKHDLKIIAYKELGRFIIARSFETGQYYLDLNDYGSSKGSIFSSDGIVGNDDDDFDDYDDYDDDEEREIANYYDENRKKITNPIENTLYSFEEFQKNMLILMGGYVANKEYNNGPYSLDKQNIYSIYNLIDESLKFGGYGLKYIHDYHSDDLNISEARLADREDLTEKVFNDMYQSASQIIKKHQKVFDVLVPLLIDRKVMDSEEVEPLISHLF